VYLGTFSSVDPGEFAGLTSRRGRSGGPPPAAPGRWTSTAPQPEGRLVLAVAGVRGGVDNQPQWTAAWDKGMNDGKYIAWSPMSGLPATCRRRRRRTRASGHDGLPQWTTARRWSATGRVLDRGAGRLQAPAGRRRIYRLAEHEPGGTAALAADSGIYPADIAAESALSTAPSYFSNQADFWSLAKQYSAQASPVTWGPDVDVAYTEFTTAFGGAVTGKRRSSAALADPVGRAERHEEERLHGRGRLTCSGHAVIPGGTTHPNPPRESTRAAAPRLRRTPSWHPRWRCSRCCCSSRSATPCSSPLRSHRSAGLVWGRRTEAGLRGAGQLRQRADRPDVPVLPAAGAALQPDPGSVSSGSPCCSRCCLTPSGWACSGSPGCRSSCVRGADGDRLAAVGFPLPATVSPFPAILSRLGLSMPNLFATHTALFSVANIGVWAAPGST